MRPTIALFVILALPLAVSAEEWHPRSQVRQQEQPGPLSFDELTRPDIHVPRPDTNGPRSSTERQEPSYIGLRTWERDEDLPSRDYAGRPTAVSPNVPVPRSNSRIGIELLWIQGGGCMPNPVGAGCLQEQVLINGVPTMVNVPMMQEQWILQVTYKDPSQANATEQILSESSLIYSAQTPKYGLQCFNIYPCDYFGISYNPALEYWSGFQPGCANKLGSGYTARVYYQYSRYRNETEVPPGAIRWLPSDPAPMREWTFKLGPRADALKVSAQSPWITPKVPARTPTTGATATGGKIIKELKAGTTTLSVEASECGTPLNVEFKLDAEWVRSSNQHLHTVSKNFTPPLDDVLTFPTTSGTTGRNGRDDQVVTAGEIGGTVAFTASTQNLFPGQTPPVSFTTKPYEVNVGFTGFRNLQLNADIIKVGHNNQTYCSAGHCDDHKNSVHWGRDELLPYVLQLPIIFREATKNMPNAPAGIDTAILGIQDMNLQHGGILDIYGDWDTKFNHITHRIGLDVDVERTWTSSTTGARTAMTAAQIDNFRTLWVKKLNGTWLKEGPLHFRPPAALIDIILK